MRSAVVLLAIAVLILSACTPVAAPTAAVPPPPSETPAPTTTPAPTETPTRTPTATPTPIPTLPPEQVGGLEGVPDPRYSNPELFDLNDPDAPIPQLVGAMKAAGVDVDERNLVENIDFVVAGDKTIACVEIIADSLPPELAGKYPILIFDPERRNFRRFYWPDLSPVDISAFFNTSEDVEALKHNPNAYRNYTFATVPFLWSYDKETNNLRDLNYRLTGVRTRNLPIMMAGSLDVEGIANASGNYGELMSSIEQQLDFIKSRIRPRIFSPLGEIHPGTPTYSLFRRFGDRFVVDVYRKAREIFGPDITLVYNETYNYARDTAYWDDTKYFVDLLNSQGIEVAIGMQMHINQYPDHGEVIPRSDKIREAMDDLGHPVYITEFDVNLERITLKEQARRAYQVVLGCLQSNNCEFIGFWATLDPTETWGPIKQAPFDEKGDPKLFYYAVSKAFLDNRLGASR